MPLLHADLPPSKTPRVSVLPSVAIEIEWALASGEREDYRRDHPVLAQIYEDHPGLLARVDEMWRPGEETSCGGFMELMVLAHEGDSCSPPMPTSSSTAWTRCARGRPGPRTSCPSSRRPTRTGE